MIDRSDIFEAFDYILQLNSNFFSQYSPPASHSHSVGTFNLPGMGTVGGAPYAIL